MDYAATAWFLGCMLLLSVKLTPFVGADDPATIAAPAGAAAPSADASVAPSVDSAGTGADAPNAGTGTDAPSAGAASNAGVGAASSASGASSASAGGDAGAAAASAGPDPGLVAPKAGAGGAPIVPCYFIFGDSLADSGNNNELKTLAKANFLPYGIDYPDGPTGRFTNGRTYVDFIAEFLGFDHHIPPFSAVKANDEKILKGANYASAGAGIRFETGRICGERVNLDSQLENHRQIVGRIARLKGNNELAAKDYLGKCLYTVGIGSNDYMNNYLVTPANPKDVVFTPERWAEELSRRIHAFLKGLYDLGARKVALYGLGPIGCEPSQVKALRMIGKPGCVDSINRLVNLYNRRLPPIIDDINKSLAGAKFTFVNNSHISPGDNPARIGVKVSDKACCPTELVAGSCIRGSTPCPNRGDYSFFDSYHPTEKAVLPGARRAFKALEPQDVYPMDIGTLARL